jgi:tRNA 2-thiouridine synthesizing protein A
MTQHLLDVRKLLCPLPVIRVQQKIKTLGANESLLVLATDPGVLYDIPAWCRLHGYVVLRTETTETDIQIEIALNPRS